jgi:hypothetical protein
MSEPWIRGPIGLGAELRVTRTGCRTVLAVLPAMAAGTRLRDLVPLLHGDHRIQMLFTVPDNSWYGMTEFAAAGGGLVIPWQQAVSHEFDLVLAASHVGLEQLHGRILVLPHGAGNQMSRLGNQLAGPAAFPHAGLARETLTKRGRLIPAALALTHEADMAALTRSCAEALPVAFVAGDICYDRMLVSAPHRNGYRRALGVADHQRLITVSTTWSPESAFGRHPDLCRRLLTEASADSRVALVSHPAIWAVHGKAQMMAWLADCVNDGLLVIPPEQGWQATIIASDHVLGDHGSTTQYAAAVGVPVTLAAFPRQNIRPGSLADRVATVAPQLDPTCDLLPQLQHSLPHADHVAEALTSKPGQAARILRTAMYRLLELAEPDRPALLAPVPPPESMRP